MVVVLKKSTTEEQVANLVSWLKAQGLEADISSGRNTTIVGLVGDVSRVDTELLEALEIVESVKRVSEPFKAANRKFHPVDTVVELSDGTKIGGGNFAVFAGPSAVESEEQILQVAEAAHRNGARILMGGAFKSRTSPYSFQGLGKEGLDLLLKAKRATGLPIMSELVDAADLDLYEDVDILQIGSRNMQNFSLLRELGHSSKPVLLKRGLANTVEEWLMSAEYILAIPWISPWSPLYTNSVIFRWSPTPVMPSVMQNSFPLWPVRLPQRVPTDFCLKSIRIPRRHCATVCSPLRWNSSVRCVRRSERSGRH